MKIDVEKAGQRRRWRLETTGAVDRSIALLIIVVVLLVAHLLGIDAGIARMVSLSL